MPVNMWGTQCTLEQLQATPCGCYGGAVRRKTLMDRAAAAGALIIDTGSYFSGSGTFFASFQGEAQKILFARANLSAWSLKYRDYLAFARTPDGGAQKLADYIASVRALDPSLPLPVASNMDFRGTALGEHVAKRTLLTTAAGVRVAYISTIWGTHLEAANPLLGARWRPLKEAIVREVDRLRDLADGYPDVVVVHISGDHDVSASDVEYHGSRIAARDAFLSEVSTQVLGIDVLLIESDHSDSQPIDAQWVTSWKGEPVLTIMGGNTAWGRTLTHVALTLADDATSGGAGGRRRVIMSPDTVSEEELDCTVPDDPETASLLRGYYDIQLELFQTTVGHVASELASQRVQVFNVSSRPRPTEYQAAGVDAITYSGEELDGEIELRAVGRDVGERTHQRARGCCVASCGLGALIADAMRDSADADVALVNCGAFASPLPAGAVSSAKLLRALPYMNELVRLTLTGRQLRVALNNSISRLAASDLDGTIAMDGRFAQVSGLSFRWHYRTHRDGSVIPELLDDSIMLNDASLVDNHTYTVATSSFLASGGDHYNSLKAASKVLKAASKAAPVSTGVIIYQAVGTYLQSVGPTVATALNVTAGGRIWQAPPFVLAQDVPTVNILGLRVESSSVYATVTVIVSVMICCGAAILYAVRRHKAAVSALQPLFDVRTGLPPAIRLPSNMEHHIFLSHTWATGQDQVAVIKRQMQHLLSGVSCFLDVDDLADISMLELHVKESVLVLCFLSRGYFLSANSMREVRAAIALDKPIIAVHEQDPTKGGASLADIRAECPADLHDTFFGARAVAPVPWLRTRAMQVASLSLVAEALLRALDAEAGARSASSPSRPSTQHAPAIATRLRTKLRTARRLSTSLSRHGPSSHALKQFMPATSTFEGACVLLSTSSCVHLLHLFKQPGGPVLYASPSNEGALEVAELLQRATSGLSVVSTPPVFRRRKTDTPVPEASRSNPRTSRRGVEEARRSLGRSNSRRGVEEARRSKASPTVIDEAIDEAIDVPAVIQLGSLAEATHMLLYLNNKTFGRAGDLLANELRLARSHGAHSPRGAHAKPLVIVLVHETRAAFGGCAFGRFFAVTPQDLAMELFKTMATPLHDHPRHVAVALSQIAIGALGATTAPATPPRTSQRDACTTPLAVVTSPRDEELEEGAATKCQAAMRARKARNEVAVMRAELERAGSNAKLSVGTLPVESMTAMSPPRQKSADASPAPAPALTAHADVEDSQV